MPLFASEPLPADVREVLEEFFAVKLSGVWVCWGRLVDFAASRFGFDGLTLGRWVFLSRTAHRDYRRRSVSGVALLGHEVQHVLQYRRLSVPIFLARYLGQWVRVGFAYSRIPLEIEAHAVEERLRERLASQAS